MVSKDGWLTQRELTDRHKAIHKLAYELRLYTDAMSRPDCVGSKMGRIYAELLFGVVGRLSLPRSREALEILLS